MTHRVLVTCPPMIGLLDDFHDDAASNGIELVAAETTQILTEDELAALLPNYDGWIIGDDPATYTVLEAGKSGRLRAAVKWGVGVDNIDFDAFDKLSMPVTNTPRQFGDEVADLAVGYLIALARQTFQIDRAVRAGEWPKPRGTSLKDKTIALIGLGDIGQSIVERLVAFGVRIIGYDPVASVDAEHNVERRDFPDGIEQADFVILACALTATNRHMINADTLGRMKEGVRLVNVSRGPLIDEQSLIDGLASGKVASAALDVFETEPLPKESSLRGFDQVIFGTHNGSNTVEAVRRASREAISRLAGFLNGD